MRAFNLCEEKGSPGITANGLYEQMNKFNFFFGLKLSCFIFMDTEKLSRALQRSDCCLQDVLVGAETVINRFRRARDDNSFKLLYSQVMEENEGLTEKPVLPRQRRPPKRYNSSATLLDFANSEEFYRRQYFEVLDIIIDMLRVRITQKTFKILCDIEKFIIDVANGPLDNLDARMELIIDFCIGDMDVDKLKAEVYMISDFVKSAINTKQMKVKQIINISMICEIFNACDIGKQMFKEFLKLVRLYLNIPVTTATAERAFSALNRLKNALRTSMCQQRLNHCLLAHIYKEKLDQIDPNEIASIFISSNENRQAFFR